MSKSNPRRWSERQFERYFQSVSDEMLAKGVEPNMNTTSKAARILAFAIISSSILLIFCLLLVDCTSGQEPGCTYPPQPLPLGSIIGTRNQIESENSFRGLNHLATVVGPDTQGRTYLVEAQQGLYGNGVQFTSLDDFLRRPYTQPIVWIPRSPAFGASVAAIAKTQVGQPYGRLASFGPQRIRGLVPAILGLPRRQSCVSAVRQQIEYASGTALWGFNVPDGMYWNSTWYAGPFLLTFAQPQSEQPPQPVVPDRRAW